MTDIVERLRTLGNAPFLVVLNHDPSDFGAYLMSGHEDVPVQTVPMSKTIPFEPSDKFSDPRVIERIGLMSEALAGGEVFPPILVRPLSDGFQVMDGHHRWRAHALAGKEFIEARVIDPSLVLEINRGKE